MEPNVNRAIIFDTNAYRDVGGLEVVVGDLVAREATHGHKGFASPIVIWELAAHLADESDPSYGECRDGLCFLWEHCRLPGSHQVRIVADPESLLCMMLFEEEPAEHLETTQMLANLADRVAAIPAGEPLPADVTALAAELADDIKTREKRFIDDMQKMVVAIDATATGWQPFEGDKKQRGKLFRSVRSPEMRHHIARAHVERAASILGKNPDDADFTALASDLEKDAAAAVELYREMLARLVGTGMDMTKKNRENYLWDMQILIGIGQEVARPGEDVLLAGLVTGDKAVREAAEAAGNETDVITVPDYLQLV